MSKSTSSSAADDETGEFDESEYNPEDWVVSPDELENGDFHTLADAADHLSE